ncbi:DUF2829 domain-containing protein [Escherichia coli]|nr:DUF2829 domain-containing protein [Escherichia coli]
MSETSTVSFSTALSSLKDGRRFDVTCGDEYTFVPGVKLLPWIGMKTADGCFVPWLASQTDLLSDDWIVIQ